jgi:hypothetical protein
MRNVMSEVIIWIVPPALIIFGILKRRQIRGMKAETQQEYDQFQRQMLLLSFMSIILGGMLLIANLFSVLRP